MARAIWSGSISFGMVSIPVKLYGATESKDIRFQLVHATCGTKLQQRRWFDASQFKDHYHEALAQLIEAKLEGKQVVTAPAPAKSRVFDLAEALKRSVEAAKKGKPKPAARTRARPARATRRTRKVG